MSVEHLSEHGNIRTLRRLISDPGKQDGRKHKTSLEELLQARDRLIKRRDAVVMKGDGGKRNGDYTIVNGTWVLWVDTVTKKELSEIKNVFSVYDRRLIGSISVREVGVVTKHLGHALSEEEIEEFIAEADPDATGYIVYPLFVQAIAKRKKFDADELLLAFNAFDESGDGLISADELRSFITSAGEGGLSKREFQEVLDEIDIDGDGFINYEEFVRTFVC